MSKDLGDDPKKLKKNIDLESDWVIARGTVALSSGLKKHRGSMGGQRKYPRKKGKSGPVLEER